MFSSRHTLFLLATAAMGVGLAGSASALDFGTTAVIDGMTYTIGAAGSPVQRLGDTLSFSLPGAVALSGTKTVDLQYSVFAAPGNTIQSVTEFGTGIAVPGSSVNFSTVFQSGSVTENSSQNNTGGAGAFPTFSHTFASKLSSWSPVTTTITLDAQGGIATASAYSAHYTESPVPEPLTLCALGIGLVGLLRRKRNN